MVILEAKLHKNRMSVHKILIFVVKMCNNGLCVLDNDWRAQEFDCPVGMGQFLT